MSEATTTPKAPERKQRTESEELIHWRKMAIQSGERLQIAETQLKDLKQAADEARARFSKYKTRLDTAQSRINELQAEVIKVSEERDALRDQVANQAIVARKVHEYRETLLNGPLWELFAELAVSSPSTTGGK